MVRVSPPPRSLGSKSRSAMAVASHEQRIDQECDQLLLDIRRIEPEGEPYVLFGKLFDDEQAQQYYEALVGTLKCAKKRGQITFKGQMLLKGMHDKVKISIVDNGDNGDSNGEGKPVASVSKTSVTAPPKPRPKPMKMPSLAEIAAKAAAKKETTVKSGEKNQTKEQIESNSAGQNESQPKRNEERRPKLSIATTGLSFSPTSSRKQLRRKGSLTKDDRVCSSDSEAVQSQDEYGIGGVSDSECMVGVRSPRRLVLPKIFMAEDCRPPAGWRLRDNSRRATIATTRSVLKSKENSPVLATEEKRRSTEPEKQASSSARKSFGTSNMPAFSAQRDSLTPPLSKTASTRSASNTLTPPRKLLSNRPISETLTPPKPVASRSLGFLSQKLTTPPKSLMNRSSSGVAAPPRPVNTRPAPQKVTPPKPVRQPPRRSVSLPVGRSNGAHEASALVDDEVVKLLVDIRRVGANPGEPTVTFGELFDDDDVQNTYEALVGTLRSAKRRGLISFKGQMLLKGMHDSVVISVVDTGAPVCN